MNDQEFGSLVLFGTIIALIVSAVICCVYCSVMAARVAFRPAPLAENESASSIV